MLGNIPNTFPKSIFNNLLFWWLFKGTNKLMFLIFDRNVYNIPNVLRHRVSTTYIIFKYYVSANFKFSLKKSTIQMVFIFKLKRVFPIGIQFSRVFECILFRVIFTNILAESERVRIILYDNHYSTRRVSCARRCTCTYLRLANKWNNIIILQYNIIVETLTWVQRVRK